jgi:hypothetical protein
MRRIRMILSLLLRDERSAMPRRAAILASLVILATMFAGLILMSFGEPNDAS